MVSMFAFPSISKYCMVGLMPSRVGVGEFLWQSNSKLSAGGGGGGGGRAKGKKRLEEKSVSEGERQGGGKCGTSWLKSLVHFTCLVKVQSSTWLQHGCIKHKQ